METNSTVLLLTVITDMLEGQTSLYVSPETLRADSVVLLNGDGVDSYRIKVEKVS